jgi:uncharacterized membrane protein YecN with MAPEG domain
MIPQVTALYAAPLALLTIGLALAIVRQRRRLRIGIGDGGDPEFARLIRVHGNLTEVAPLGILMLLLAELGGASGVLLHACGGALLVGRLLHAWGLSQRSGRSTGRFLGSLLSWGALVVLAVTAFLLALRV